LLQRHCCNDIAATTSKMQRARVPAGIVVFAEIPDIVNPARRPGPPRRAVRTPDRSRPWNIAVSPARVAPPPSGMDASTISFYLASTIALASAIVGMLTRRPERALACFALVGAALVVPLVQLGAGLVAAIELFTVMVGLALVLGLVAQGRGRGEAKKPARPSPKPIAAWVLAGGALLGFAWVLLATGSRQVAEAGAKLEPGFGESAALHEQLFGRYLVPLELVGLIALVVLVAAVLAVDRSKRVEGGERA
jgi:NADH:ubiquinone oxidoreductase subunit 6 (subunit J)